MAFESWDYYFEITIDKDKVPSTQTDFPVFLDLADLGAGHGFWSAVKSDGGDIRITESDGSTEVAREIVDIDTTAKTGEVHFLVGSLSSTADTVYRVYYGNAAASEPAASATYGSQNVWPSSYRAVYHCSGASATDIKDSTSNGNDVASDDGTPQYNLAGKLGKAIGSEIANDSYLEVPDDDSLSFGDGTNDDPMTLSCWHYQDVASSVNLIRKYQNPYEYMLQSRDDDDFRVYLRDNSSGQNAECRTNNNDLVESQWQHLVMAYDGSENANGVSLYIDGTETGNYWRSTGGTYTAMENTSSTLRLNWAVANRETHLCEIRIIAGELSADWITTEHNNQNSPSTFYSVGAQQSNGAPAASFRPIIITEV